MCGIAGIVGNVPQEEVIALMIEIMNHRGPDAKGIYISKKAHLGHCRLSINDLSENANQPLIDEKKTTVVLVNGEIYNYMELKKQLLEAGYKFKSSSDSEVALYGYLEYGLDFLPELNGMFAIAIWNTIKNELILLRDRLGIKPLYYVHTKQSFLFASEIKALAQYEGLDFSLDLQSFSEYLSFENYFSNRTLNKHIKIVEPGEVVKFDLLNSRVSRSYFWKPKVCIFNNNSNRNVYQHYSRILKASVERHLMSDVPLGCYLSSGIDSSSVTYWASNILEQKIKTYTGYFGISGFYDEALSAKKIAEFFGCDNTRVNIQPEDFSENIENIIYHLDEPRVGAGSFSQYMVAKRAAEDVKVILTGHGGDEFFAGYPVFKAIIGKKNIFKLLSSSTLTELMFFAYFSIFPLVKKEIRYFLPNIFSLKILKNIMDKDFYGTIQANTNYALEVEKLKEETNSEYEQLLYTYLKLYLPSLFIVEDKISMAFSLESRTPLCDNEMLQFALSIPLSQKLKNNELKHIPRKAMQNNLPNFIYNLPKRGFPTPIRKWFKKELGTFVNSFILDNYRWIDFFNKDQVEKLIRRFQDSPVTTPYDEIRAHRIWILLNLVIYFRIQHERYSRCMGVPLNNSI